MEMITVTKNNIEKEHICCAISNNKDIQVMSKKKWLLEQFDQGLVFKKMDVRGKCFIEYLPLEAAWVPIIGESLMYINCLWVSGKYQGQGYASELLEACRQDSIDKGKKGLVVLSAKKKVPFVMDYKFLVKHGFVSVATLDKYELMFLSFDNTNKLPSFTIDKMNCQDDGFALYYSHQCPFTAKYVPLIESYCKEHNISFKAVLLKNVEEAKKVGTIFTTYSLFYNYEFITREILSVKKFEKLMEELV